MVMSAMLSTEGRWERCSRELARIRHEFGFSIFHATEFRALRGEFQGWSAHMCFNLYMALGRLGASYLTECFTISLSHEIYRTCFLERRPRKMHQVSQYGICFMGLLDGLMRTVMPHGRQSKLSVVVESGHKNAGDTKRLFEDRKRRLDAVGVDLLHTHVLAKKEDNPLLQLADITAHAHTHDKRAIKAGTAPEFSTRKVEGPVMGEPGWTVFEVAPKYISSIIDEYNNDRAAKSEDYLKRRAAWLASRSAGDAA
jgi:hypothetical protein